jgi:hypothetical protein
LRAARIFQGHFEVKIAAAIWKNRKGKIVGYSTAKRCSTRQYLIEISEIKY